MQGPPNQPHEHMSSSILTTIMRQLERLDERTRDLATRADMEALRKEVVTRDLLESQLAVFRTQISRLNDDRNADRKDMEERLKEIEEDHLSRGDRTWIRLTQVVAFFAFLLSLFEFLTHLKLTP